MYMGGKELTNEEALQNFLLDIGCLDELLPWTGKFNLFDVLKITRAEIEAIRGVNSDGTIYKLLEYNLIAESGKSDAPGRPMTFSTTSQFLKMFGISNLNDLPELPKYKLDENRQIVIDEIIEENSEAPIPSEEENN